LSALAAWTSEQAILRVIQATHFVIVENNALNASILSKRASLWFDLLRCEDTSQWRKEGVAAQKVKISSQLFDAIDIASALNLHRNVTAFAVTNHQINGTNRRRKLAAHKGNTLP